MPTYVYERKDGTRFEAVESIKADSMTVCPDTGQPVHRVPCGGSFVLSGTGWPGLEAKDAYTRVGLNDKGEIRVKK